MYCEMVEPAIPWVFIKILSLLEDGVLTKVLYKRNHFVRACPPIIPQQISRMSEIAFAFSV